VQGNRCICGQGKRAEQVGANAFRCVGKGGDGGSNQQEGGQQQGGAAKIVCQGGTAAGGSCVCGPGKKLQQLGARRFRCVNAGGGQQLQDGSQQGGDQQKKKKKQQGNQQGGDQQGGNQARKKQQGGGGVQCLGGRPAGNRCICPQGQRAVQVAPKVFQCQAKGG
jgi:hypothetical protein